MKTRKHKKAARRNFHHGINFCKAPHQPHVAYINRRHTGLGRNRIEAVVSLLVATMFGFTVIH